MFFNIPQQYTYFRNSIKEYFKDKYVILLEVGSFYELYASNDEEYSDLKKISEITNLIITRKHKQIEIFDTGNPYLMGFPAIVKKKYINLLKKYNYNIILIDQNKLNSIFFFFSERKIRKIIFHDYFFDKDENWLKKLNSLKINVKETVQTK